MKARTVGILAALACCASLQAAPVIYEPFADSNGSLTGNSPGTGLAGTWTASATFAVSAPGQTWGTLPVSANKVNYSGTAANSAASVSLSSALNSAGLLANGETLWFSMIIQTPDTAGPNPDTGFAIGTDTLGSGNGLPMNNSGSGVGWTIQNGSLRSTIWVNGAANRSSGLAVSVSTLYLIVGKITWDASGGSDRIDLFLPDANLNLGAVRQTLAVAINQSAFDTIAYGMKSNTGFGFDEIRFGGTYLDVIGGAPAAAYWDIDGVATVGAGGAAPAGTWDASTTANWSSDSTGASATTTWSAGNQAVFAAGTDATGPYTVAVSGTPVIGGLSFEEGTVTLSGGTGLDLVTAGGALEVRPATATATIATPLTQTTTGGNLYKEGSGTLTLSGNNTYGCPTIMNAGTLILSGDNSGAGGAITLNAGIVQFDSVNAINGSGRNVTVNANTVAMFANLNDTDIATGLGRVVTTSAGVIAADNNSSSAFNLNTAGLTAAYFGAVGSVNFTGALTPNGTVYRLGGGGGTLTMANANALTGSGKTLTVSGPGTVVLSAANNLTGATTINGGATLVVGNASSTGGSALAITLNGALVIGSSSPFNSGKAFFSTGALIRSDSTTARSFSSVVQGNANNTIILGDLVNSGKLTATGNWMMSSSQTYYLCNSDIELTGGIQSSTSGFTKQGPATMILSGNNLHQGSTTVSVGVLRIGHNGGLGTTDGGVTVSSGAVLELHNNITVGAEALSLSGTGISNGGALRNIAGTNTYGGLITLAANARINSESGSSLTLDVATGNAIAGSNFALTFGGAGGVTVADPIATGTGTLAKWGTGTLVLAAVNTYSGATTINNGTLIGVVGGSCDNSDVTVNTNGTLSVSVTDSTEQWSCKSVTVSTATGTKLKYVFDLEPSTSLAPLKILNNLTFTGMPTVEVDPANLKRGKQYPLLVVVGTPPAPNPLPTLSGVDGRLSWSGDGKTLYLNVPTHRTVMVVM